MSIKRFAYFGFALMLVALVAVPAIAAGGSDLAARAATWEKEYNADNLQAVVALYADDGCRMPPNQTAVCGSEAILGQLKGGKEQGITKVKIAVTTDDANGDWSYGAGTYEILGADGSHVDHGKWMNVSKKMNGKWIIQRDIFNSDMPIPTTTK